MRQLHGELKDYIFHLVRMDNAHTHKQYSISMDVNGTVERESSTGTETDSDYGTQVEMEQYEYTKRTGHGIKVIQGQGQSSAMLMPIVIHLPFGRQQNTERPGHTSEALDLKAELCCARRRIQELEEKWGAAIEYSGKLEEMNEKLTMELEQRK